MPKKVIEIESFSLEEHLAAKQAGEFLLVDVRTPDEYEHGHIPGSRLIPLDQLESRLDELPPGGELVFYCRSGRRSMAAALLARDSGRFDETTLSNLKGGFSAYQGIPLQGFPRLLDVPKGRSLRDSLQWAMNMEKGAGRVYAQLSGGNAPAGRHFLSLAALERAHARTVYEMLARREQLPSFEETYAQLSGEIVEGGESVEAVVARLADKGCLEAAELAMEIEKMAYDLYRNLAERKDGKEIRPALLALAEAEKDHIRVLARIFKDCG
jgi:sulfur-carrier protein adenylyltransferase/sulfurtransferase